MTIMMKLISLGFDLESGRLVEIPDLFNAFCYLFSVPTTVFGPWISYRDHQRIFDRSTHLKLVNFHLFTYKLLFFIFCV